MQAMEMENLGYDAKLTRRAEVSLYIFFKYIN